MYKLTSVLTSYVSIICDKLLCKPCSQINKLCVPAQPANVHAQLWEPWELLEDDGTALGLKLMAVE